jgi:hypothetical protein
VGAEQSIRSPVTMAIASVWADVGRAGATGGEKNGGAWFYWYLRPEGDRAVCQPEWHSAVRCPRVRP